MKTLQVFIGALFLLGFVGSSQALTVSPDVCTANLGIACFTSDDNGSSDDTVFPVLAGLDLLYKYETDTGETGSGSAAFADSYSTTNIVTDAAPDDFLGATIEYDSGDKINCVDPCYLTVKDGRHLPARYLFNLALLGWDGMADIVLENFWPGGGSISNFAIYGNVNPIPVPAAFWLFGTALLGFIGYSRRVTV